jgi:DNA mismatch repair protein MutS
MSELAYILNTATEKSLIILDEIGRGTSTYDGLSIAWAVVEYLTDDKHRIRTLFATHYHELTELAGKVRGLTNLNVDIAEKDGNIIFLHKIIPGSASRSYGIHVARLAGVPENVLGSAEEKLALLESEKAAETAVAGSQEASPAKDPGEAPKAAADRPAPQEQLSLFSFNDSVLAEKVRNLDLMNITPSQAIAVLEELQKLVER